MVPPVVIFKLPETVSGLETVSTAFVLLPIVKDKQLLTLLTVGLTVPVKAKSPIIALTVAVGTPFVQLLAVPQAVVPVPFQLVLWALNLFENAKASVKKIKRFVGRFFRTECFIIEY